MPSSPAHVAINAVFLDPPMGGMETYLRELCTCLLAHPDAPRLTVLLNPAGHAKLVAEPWAAEAELVSCPTIGRPGARMIGELTALGALVDRRRADLVHSVAMTGPLATRARRVVTVPDTIWITHPDDATITHRLWRATVPLVARRAHRVVAISHAAGEALKRDMGVPGGKLDVVPLGYGTPALVTPTGDAELRAKLGLGPGPIVLNVGQKKPHRNIERLIEAMVAVRERVADAQLVLPGPPDDAAEKALRALAARYGLGGAAVTIPGYLETADLEGLYAAARAFVLPSLVEGFGLPVLEAMARGVPVACSRDSAPGEVAGDAGLTLDPMSVASIAQATVALLTDDELRSRLVSAGRSRAASYTWERCADETLAVYAKALRRPGRP